jgi:hypothetical protein
VAAGIHWKERPVFYHFSSSLQEAWHRHGENQGHMGTIRHPSLFMARITAASSKDNVTRDLSAMPGPDPDHIST